MKLFTLFATVLVLIAGCVTPPPPVVEPTTEPVTQPVVAPPAADFRETPPDPLAPRPWEFPEVTRVTLDNGLRVLVAENHSAPLATIRAVVRSGAEYDPSGDAGLATFTADMLDEGAGGMTAIEIAEAFGNLGTQIGTWAEWDMSGAGVDVLSANLDPALELFATVLLDPAFQQSDADRLRAQRIALLVQQRDNASVVANNRFASIVYGQTPYGRAVLGTEESVADFARDDVLAFYRRYYVPNNASIIVTGDVDSDAVIASLRGLFGEWDRGPEVQEIAIDPPPREANEIFIIDRPQAVQSEIRVGHAGVARSTEDFFPLLVMNTILGGNFGSRININLRERHGYTYGARSAFSFRREEGPFYVSTPVRTEVTLPAVQEIMGELRRIREGDVSDEELAAAKNYQAGIFPATVESASDLANRLTDLEVYGLPEDYFETYQQQIMSVTAEDVRNVANEYLSPGEAAIVIVGKASDIQQPLAQLGFPVGIYDLEGNPVVK
ncbi:MAG: M16 family metallopeptidase [Thermoanaerobaculia bacterium]